MIKPHYLTVKIAYGMNAFSLDCYMSTADFWQSERHVCKYAYTYIGNRCEWLIRSDAEMTPKMIQVVGEQADRWCAEGAEKNATRKVSNR